jgi:dihydrofolate reductase
MSSDVDPITNPRGFAPESKPGDPRLVLVVAVAANGVIGRNGSLPWHLPADLKHFKALTIGQPVLMGRRTYESIGKALVDRPNIVLTRNLCWEAPRVIVVHTLEAAIERARPAPELMVIGGADIFSMCLPVCSRIELTRVHADVEGDTFFPLPPPSEWRESAREDHPADARHTHAFSIVTLERIDGSSREGS